MPEVSPFPQFLCNGDFDDKMLEKFIAFNSYLIDNQSKEACILIDSPGGYVTTLNSMLSIIENSDVRFHTVAIGSAASCGLLLLAGGDVRYATDRAQILFHDISAGTFGHPDEMLEDIERIKKLSSSVLTKFAKKTKHNLTWWKKEADKRKSRDFWFDSKKALDHGVIDHIGMPKIEIVTAGRIYL